MPRPRFSLRTLAVFLVVVTAATGLWRRRDPWSKALSFDSGFEDYTLGWTNDGLTIWTMGVPRLERGGNPHVWVMRHDASDGTLLHETATEPYHPCRHGRLLFDDPPVPRHAHRFLSHTRESGHLTTLVHDAGSGNILARLDQETLQYWFCHREIPRASFSPDGVRLAFAGPTGIVAVYRRRRPEQWWGMFWLWEFWLTASLAGLLAWSVRGDRRRLRRP